MKPNVKKNIRSSLFLIGFFVMPNAFFLLSVIYKDVAEEAIHQEVYGTEHRSEHVNIYLTFTAPPGSKEQREVDAIIGQIQVKLHNKNQGKVVTHDFNDNGVSLKLSGKNADDLLESAREVLLLHEVNPGSYARKIYNDEKQPVTVQF